MLYFDISVSLSPSLPVYPGDPPVEIQPVGDVAKGDPVTLSRITMSNHAGTHLDAPRHIAAGGTTVDELPLSLLIGRAKVVELPRVKEIGRRELSRHGIRGESRILLKTPNSALWDRPDFSEDYAYISAEGAEYLAEAGVKLVGIDYLSVDRFNGGDIAHRILLGHGIAIVEGLDLRQVMPGVYELICLPLKLKDADGAPVRAILRGIIGETERSEFDPHSTRWPLS